MSLRPSPYKSRSIQRIASTGLCAVALCSLLVPGLAASGEQSIDAELPPAADPPPNWLEEVQQQLAEQEYEWSWQTRSVHLGGDSAWQAPNRVQDLRSYVDGSRVQIVPRRLESPSWLLELQAFRYGEGTTAWIVGPGTVDVNGNRVESQRDGFIEWFLNRRQGLEHGMQLASPPAEWAAGSSGTSPAEVTIPGEAGSAPVSGWTYVDLALHGELRPVLATDRQSIEFLTGDGTPGIRYAKLIVTDAQDQVLPSRMELFAEGETRGVRLAFDAADAVFPVTVDPLATSASWSVESDQAGAGFGLSVGTAGDVNGDGYSDIAIGAYAFDNGETDEGRVFVYHGSPTGPAPTASWTAEVDQAGARFGYSVSTAGDANGDGFSDLIVGAYLYDNGDPNEGAAFLYFGSAAGLSSTADWSVEGDQQGAQLGNSVSSAGDVNNDGFADLLVGAYSYDLAFKNEGAAFVYLGTAGVPAATPAWTRGAHQEGASFGYSVSTAGDVNGDGFADVIVGARFYDDTLAGEGRAFVYRGSAAGLSNQPSWTADGEQTFALFGSSVSTAGDLNGDGYSDVIVGAPFFDNGQESEGRADVYFGSAAGLSNAAGWTQEGDRANARFGSAVSHAGDLNGDGHGDIAVGAPIFQQGRVFVYRGSASGPASAPSYILESGQAGSNFGSAVSAAGDTNGDGFGELIVGAYSFSNGASGEGTAFTYLGSPDGPGVTPGWSYTSEQVDPGFGFAVAGVGDVNGDGFGDVVIGAPRYDISAFDDGAAFGFYGGPKGLELVADWIVNSGESSAQFGAAVSGAGDVNGDGYSDVIVGAPGFDFGTESNTGAAFVYEGSPSGLSTVYDWTNGLTQANALAGTSVDGAGDVDGDGYDDVIVGLPFHSNPQLNEGQAAIYRGSFFGLGFSPSWTVELNQGGERLGTSVAGAGDVNGDGFADVIVGAPNWDEFDTDAGIAAVYLGGALGLEGSAAWDTRGDRPFAGIGRRVASAGDVNGDGLSDVAVGAWAYDNGEIDEGAAWVFHGTPTGIEESASWMAEGDEAEARFGDDISGAGDVNGDGFADFLVGASRMDGVVANAGAVFLYAGSSTGLAQTPIWNVSGTGQLIGFGSAVAGAGDVNGDGYADIVLGISAATDDPFRDGEARLYFGGNGPAVTVRPRQLELGTEDPIELGGDADGDGFRISALGRSSYGRGRARLETEVKPFGVPFDGLGTSTQPLWSDTEADGVTLIQSYAGLATGSYRWRARLRYDSSNLPFAAGSRWFTVPSDSWETVDVVLPDLVDLAVTQVDSPDPVASGQIVTYSILVENFGPSPAGNVVVEDTIPIGSSFSVASFDFTGGSCIVAEPGLIRCQLLDLDVGADKTVNISLNARPTTGTMINRVDVYPLNARDPDIVNNSVSEFTFVGDPELGDFVWNDLNRDGIQDPGEPGLAGIQVELLRSLDDSLVFSSVSNAFGQYGFSLLDLEDQYYLRFFPPPGFFITTKIAPGSTSALDSDADPLSGETEVFGFGGNDPLAWDAGFFSADIEGRIWEDEDGDGIEDPGEPGSFGVTVELYNSLGSLVGTQSSDGQGQYRFQMSTPYAVHSLRFLPPANRFLTFANVGIDDDIDSDPNPFTGFTEEFALLPFSSDHRDAGLVDAVVGDRVWADDNGDGIQDAGETGVPNVVVALADETGNILSTTFTDSEGLYRFPISNEALYRLRFIAPVGKFFTLRDEGSSDFLDSDADPFTGETGVITPDPDSTVQWDAGLTDCPGPDEPVFIYAWRVSTDGNDYTIVDFEDPNQPSQRTGYNVYRSSDAGLPQDQWELVASNVVDGDQATPNNQWIDITDDPSPNGMWFYEIAAFNADCGLEGPR